LPAKFVPVISTVWDPPLVALVGEIRPIVGVEVDATVVMVALEPVADPSVAVKVYEVAVVLVVNVTVAIPFVLVVLVAAEKVPVDGVLDHETIIPVVGIAVPLS
jgi:hypothetical protein